MKKSIFFVFLFFFSVLSLQVLAQGLVLDETPVPFGTVLESIGELIKNWKGLGGIGLASAILATIIQFLKTDLMGGFLDKAGRFGPNIRRLIILVLGQVSGVILSLSSGKFSWVDAIVSGLITQGGAVAIYEYLKPFFKKSA